MAQAHPQFFADERSRDMGDEATVARLEALARLLDGAFAIPATNQRVGLDAIIGLVPVLGSAATAVMSAYIILEARRLGLPGWKVARMIGNVALDSVLGSIPIAGNVFDVFFRSNQRNVRILLDHLGRRRSAREIDDTAVRVGERPR
jgi:hypothetical protein